MVNKTISFIHHEMHRPATLQALLGAAAGLAVMIFFGAFRIPATAAEAIFWVFHPIRVLLCAMATMRLLDSSVGNSIWKKALFSYVFSIMLVTLTDSILPYLAEFILLLPSRHFHLGFIEMWWLVNPAAVAGIVVAVRKPSLRIHPILLTLATAMAPLFDIMMAMWEVLSPIPIIVVTLFLFLSVRSYFHVMSVLLPQFLHCTGLDGTDSTGSGEGR